MRFYRVVWELCESLFRQEFLPPFCDQIAYGV
jgi:hypothetical protein